MPSEALQELDEDPHRLAIRIIPVRDFVRAFERYERWCADERSVKEKGKLPETPMIQRVKQLDFAISNDLSDEELAELIAEDEAREDTD